MEKTCNQVSPDEYDVEYFDVLSKCYLLFDLWTHIRVSDVIRVLKPKKNEKILDIGCGWGTYSIECAKRGAIVTGIDYSIKSIECAKKLSGMILGENKIDFRISNANKLPFADETYDKVVSADLIEHISREDFIMMLAECKRVLKSKGQICIYTPNKAYFDIFYYFYGGVDAYLKRTGLANFKRLLFSLVKALLGIPYMFIEDRRVKRLKKEYYLDDVFPVLSENYQNYVEQRKKYEYLHIDIKAPETIVNCLKTNGFRIKEMRLTRGYTIFQRLPYPFSKCFGKVVTILSEKIS